MKTTKQSRMEWNKFRELECRRHQSFFLPQYERLGMEIVQDIANDTKTNSYDVLARKNGLNYRIEEKTRTGHWDHFLVEIMQCLRDGQLGWFYNQMVDYIFDAQFESEANEQPHTVYSVRFDKLREFVIANFEDLPGGTSEKGYGLTYFKKAKWIDLKSLGIAKRLI